MEDRVQKISPEDANSAQSTAEKSMTRVLLYDAAPFKRALERYVDENKPDPLQLRQISSWVLEWTDDDDDDCGRIPQKKNHDEFLSSFAPSHVLSGRLTIRGEYVQVTLQSSCWWNNDGEKVTSSLFYQCTACAKLLPTPQSDDGAKTTTSSKKKVHKQIIQRLSTDDYVAKLLLTENDMASVFEARILQFPPNGLEERVHCAQDVAEGIRRAIFSKADSTLDVFDILMHMPSLPGTIDDDASSSSSRTGGKTRLADRARLRLLEDAMCDACEQEGEDELLKELDLAGSNEKADHGDDERTESKKSKRRRWQT